MTPVEWDPDLETGDELVDRQHRGIHELSNQLESAEDSPTEIMRVLGALLDHVAVHFATEEDLMRRESYPSDELEAHIALHRELTAATRQHVLDFRDGRLNEVAPLADFVRDWVTIHVRDHDRALVEYMRARGVVACLPLQYASSASRSGTADRPET